MQGLRVRQAIKPLPSFRAAIVTHGKSEPGDADLKSALDKWKKKILEIDVSPGHYIFTLEKEQDLKDFISLKKIQIGETEYQISAWPMPPPPPRKRYVRMVVDKARRGFGVDPLADSFATITDVFGPAFVVDQSGWGWAQFAFWIKSDEVKNFPRFITFDVDGKEVYFRIFPAEAKWFNDEEVPKKHVARSNPMVEKFTVQSKGGKQAQKKRGPVVKANPKQELFSGSDTRSNSGSGSSRKPDPNPIAEMTPNHESDVPDPRREEPKEGKEEERERTSMNTEEELNESAESYPERVTGDGRKEEVISTSVRETEEKVRTPNRNVRKPQESGELIEIDWMEGPPPDKRTNLKFSSFLND